MIACILCMGFALVLLLNNLWSLIGKYRMRRRDRMWFNALFTDEMYVVINLIISHQHDFGQWVRGFGGDDVYDSEEVIDVSMLVTYLNVLEACSMFERCGFISEKVYWADLEDNLWDILDCKELRRYISLSPRWFALKMKLAETALKRGD